MKSVMNSVLQSKFQVKTTQGTLQGILHSLPNTTEASTCSILICGAGGGTHGPANVYELLANNLVSSKKDMICIRLDYRRPNYLEQCIEDVRLAMENVKSSFGIQIFALVSWSFGGAVALSAASLCKDIKVCVTIASQTYGTSTIGKMNKDEQSCLFIHGSGDTCLSDRCSKQLFHACPCKDKQLKIYDEDNHGITHHKQEMHDLVSSFILSRV